MNPTAKQVAIAILEHKINADIQSLDRFQLATYNSLIRLGDSHALALKTAKAYKEQNSSLYQTYLN